MFKDLSDAPVGSVKNDFTITTMKEIYTDMFIRTIAGHMVASGYRKVKHGEWGDTGDFELDHIYSGWKCSLCGHTFCGNKTNYCAGCGAKMDGATDNNVGDKRW